MRARRLRAGLLGASLIVAPAVVLGAPGDLPNLGTGVSVVKLPVGGTAIVQPAQGAPVAAIELWYRAPSTGFGPKPVPATARLAAQIVAASKPILGPSLGGAVDAVGGRLGISVYGDSVAVTAVVPAQSAAAIVKTMTTAYFAPVMGEDGYRDAMRDVVQEAEDAAYNPETVSRDAVFGALFSGGPQHYSVLGDPHAIASISLADAKSYATRAFRSSNAVLVVSGAVDPSITGAATDGRTDSATQAVEAPAPAELASSIEPVTKTFAIDAGAYGWLGPAIDSPREATAMDFIADYLFRTDVGVVTRGAERRFPDSFVRGQFITLHDPGVMFVTYGGGDVTALRGLVDDGFASVRKPLDPATFAKAMTAFKFHLLSDLQTPAEVADNFGWYSVEGDAEYAPGANGVRGAYFKAADSLTPQFVAQVAEKYLGKTPVTVTLQPESHAAKVQSQ